MAPVPFSDATLRALSPEILVSYRPERYLGTDISVSITTLRPPD